MRLLLRRATPDPVTKLVSEENRREIFIGEFGTIGCYGISGDGVFRRVCFRVSLPVGMPMRSYLVDDGNYDAESVDVNDCPGGKTSARDFSLERGRYLEVNRNILFHITEVEADHVIVEVVSNAGHDIARKNIDLLEPSAVAVQA
jgi:hypothetical protein